MGILRIILALICVLLPVSAWPACSWVAQVGTAADATQAEFQACVNDITSSMSGTVTINIPAGTQTWATGNGVSIDMTDATDPAPNFANVTRVVIAGADRTTTLLTDGLPAATGALFIANVPSGKTIDISKLGITGKTGTNLLGAIKIYGGTTALRVHEVDIAANCGGGRFGLTIGAYTDTSLTYGLIDDCTFTNTGAGGAAISQFFNNTNLATSWARTKDEGGAANLYVENNAFNFASLADGAIDSYTGSSWVFRYNDVERTAPGDHGNDSSATGTLWMETYNNKFTNAGATMTRLLHVRGGSLVFFNNQIEGAWSEMIRYHNYRSCPNWAWGEGVSNNSDNSATTLSVAGTPFAGVTINTAWYLYNQEDGSLCEIDSNTDSTVTCDEGLSGGTNNYWSSGNHFWIVNYRNDLNDGGCTGYSAQDQNSVGGQGYICSQQPGTTGSDGLTSAPAYAWHNYKVATNTWNQASVVDAVTNTGGEACSRATVHLQSGRDFFDNGDTAKAGYTAYTCPHPLADPTASGSCSGAAGTAGYSLSETLYTVTPATSGDCVPTLSPANATAITSGDTIEITATFATNCTLDAVTGISGSGTWAGQVYTFTSAAITEDKTITFAGKWVKLLPWVK